MEAFVITAIGDVLGGTTVAFVGVRLFKQGVWYRL